MRKHLLVALAVSVGAVLASPSAAVADEFGASKGFRKAVTPQNISKHLQGLQEASDAHGGNRAGGSDGYEASADYVRSQLEAVGYTVTDHNFDFVYNADRTPPVFQQTAPDQASYVDGVDFSSMTYSPNGDVTANVVAVDLVLPPGPDNSSTSGCEAADFAGFPAGAIALVQRGTCSFAIKGQNAAAAGASAVVVFNEGQPGRTASIAGTLGGPQTHNAPVLGTSFAIGEDLANGVRNGDTGSTARVRVDRVNETRTTRNVIAERVGTDPGKVVVAGAHLDSVPRGPGINDNGTGTGTILEIARVMAQRDITPRNTVRFMWYGAEEFGLLGSEAYVDSLPEAELDRIEAMVNFDMVGSPNFVRFVYDGDNSAFPVGGGVQEGPAGSGEIERLFAEYFTSQGLASSPTPFNGRSDYGPFIAKGIPAGGLFTGAEGIKTAEQAAVYGGTAGEAYDKCYHLACDTIDNVNMTGLDQMSDAAAHVILTLSRRNLDKDPLVDPPSAGNPADGGGGGGLHDDHEEHES
jgi:Predicted aminopeptidases